MGDKFEFFSENELKCRCGKCGLGQDDMDIPFMEKLINLRRITRIPMKITSAVRCPTWNNKQSSTGFQGPHTPLMGKGHAVDINVWGINAYTLLQAALERNLFTGIGLKQVGPYPGRFIHLDDLEETFDINRPWIWTY